MSRDAFVALLESFAERNRLPVETGAPVTALVRDEENDGFRLVTPRGTLLARNVVIASGNLNRPRRPPFFAALPPSLLQLDASAYRRPDALPPGAVLVVGSAQTGGQVAEDLVQVGRTVFLATCRVGRIPRRYRERDAMLWMVECGLMDVPRTAFAEPSGRIAPRPLTGRATPSACSP